MKTKALKIRILFLITSFILLMKISFSQDVWYAHNIIPPNPLPDLNGVHWMAMSNTYGLTVGNNGFVAYYTMPISDWWMQSNVVTTKNLNSVFLVDSLTYAQAFIVGDNGCMIKITSYPFQGTTLNFITSRNLYSVYFFNYLSGIAVGDTGTVVKTTNGGANWSIISAVTQNRLYSLHFPSSNIGYAVGKNGIVIKTTDNGNKWVTKSAPVTDTLRGVWFTSDNTGYVVSRNGGIFKTTDGGTTWQLKPSGTTENLNAVCFSNASTGYVAGNYNTVLKTTNAGDTWQIQGLPAMPVGNFQSIAIKGNGGVTIVGSHGLAIGNFPEPGLIQEETGKNILSLFPNPAQNKITINLQFPLENKDLNLSIYNLRGQLLLQQSLHQNNTEIDISQFPQGVYFAEIQLKVGSFVQKKFVVIK